MRGLLELESGWWVMVGGFVDHTRGPIVTMVMQFDPAGELPTHGIKSLRLTEPEAEKLDVLLHEALEGLRRG